MVIPLPEVLRLVDLTTVVRTTNLAKSQTSTQVAIDIDGVPGISRREEKEALIRGDFAALWSFARRGEPWCVLRDGRCCGLLRGCEIIPLPITYSPPRRKPGSIASSHELFTGLAGKALRLFDAPVSVDRWVQAFAGMRRVICVPAGPAPRFFRKLSRRRIS